MRFPYGAAWCCGLLLGASACGTPAPVPQATADADTAVFVPFDSSTLVATCRGSVSSAEDSMYRIRVSDAAAHPGVLLYAAPTPQRPCYQLGVTSAALRDSLALELRRAGVPDHIVTYLHLTAVPPDDVDQGAAVPDPA
jgi:hypothetical protein